MTDIDTASLRRLAEQRAQSMAHAREAKKRKAEEAAQALAPPTSVPRPDPPGVVAQVTPDRWVRLERVRFTVPVEVPGRDAGIYPVSSSVVETDPSRGQRSLILYLDPEEREIILEHPESRCRERVPMHNVQQMRRPGDHPGGRPSRKVGMVESIE